MTGKIKKIFGSIESRNGSYSVGITALVLVIIIVVNLIVGQLPESIRNIDISSNNIYEITDTSREMLGELDKEVQFTVLAAKGDADERIKTFISKYTALSSKISVEWIDPVLHPSALTEHEASSNSIVISCEETGKKTTVSFDSIIVMDTSSYYYTGSVSESEFDGEGQLTSAINYVTTEDVYSIYRTSGHGEATFSTSLTELMNKANYQVTELNTMMTTEIPQDCDLLLMYAPTNDLSKDETTMITDYLAAGGKVMVLLGDTDAGDLPNLEGIMKTYGLEEAEGYITDPSRCYQNNYYALFPELSVSGDLANGISSEMVLVMNSHGLIQVDAARDTITTTPFMATSENGYAVTEEAQSQGSYILGAVATENVTVETEEDTLESRLTVIAASSLIDAQITDTFTTLENQTLFMNLISANFEGVKNLSIEAKSLVPEYNTVQHGGFFAILVIFILPLIVLIGGFFVWLRRRKA